MPIEVEPVCYTFVKAGDHLDLGRGFSKRVGLVATNSTRGGANCRALDGRPIFNAWGDEPWMTDEEFNERCALRRQASG